MKDPTERQSFEPSHPDSTKPPIACVKCGSRRIIPRVRIADQGANSNGWLKAVVVGNPGALIFRNQVFAEIRADICGECGHLELRVDDPEHLYDHYLETLG